MPSSAKRLTGADVLPPTYHFLFATLEPIITVGGVLLAIVTPGFFHKTLIPSSVAPKPTEAHLATLLSIRQLGSCFLIITLFGSLLLRRTARVLANYPALLEPIVAAYVTCLTVGDIGHVGLTMYDLGLKASLHPLQYWNMAIAGNIVITSTMFIARTAWLAGIGRKTLKGKRD